MNDRPTTDPAANPVSTTAPRRAARRATARAANTAPALALAAAAVALTGCSSGPGPAFRVVSITETARSDEAVVLDFAIEAENRTDEPLPLQRVSYGVTLDGVRVFEGQRAARATAPRFGTQVVELPVVVPADLLPLERFDSDTPLPYVLEGTVEYQTPGRFAEFLFDLNLRRPKAGLRETGVLELGPPPADG